MASRGYMPRGDAKALAWFENFAAGLGARPWGYGVSPAEAETIRYVVDRFAEAMRLAKSPGTRCRATVLEKDRARAVAYRTCSSVVHQVKANLGVTDADKLALGVWPRGPGGAVRPGGPPTTAPVLGIVGMTPGRQVLTYRDAVNPDPKAKPAGVTAVEVWRAVGDGPVRDVKAARWAMAATRTPFVVALEHRDDGKVATYFARYVTRRGQFGPWSQPVSMTVAA